MTRTTRALLGAALLAGAAPAGAQTIDFGTVCGSLNGATSCADVSAQLFASYMEVRVQNAEGAGLPGDPSRITGIGIYYLGGASMGAAGTLAAPVPGGNWENGFVGSGGQITSPGPVGSEVWLLGASVGGAGGIYGCTDPTGGSADVPSCAGPLTFRFDFASTADIRMQDLEFAFRAQSVGATGESTKCYTSDPAGSAMACEPWTPPTVTPEPTSVVLMASGLLGVFGVARRRRRTA